MTPHRTPSKHQAKAALSVGGALDRRPHQAALRLPMPGPGIAVNVSLSVLPNYLAIYDLVPMTRAEVSEYEHNHQVRKPAGVVWVKRVKRNRHKDV